VVSRTHKHTKQQKLKTKLEKRKLELGDEGSGMSISTYFDPEIQRAIFGFHRGSLRHGNKRKYEAYRKWKLHKKDRYEARHQIEESSFGGL